MKQVLYDKSGKVRIEDVPLPNAGKNMVLVKNNFSLISSGTEKSMISLMKKPLYQMALERKDLTKQVLKFAKDSGIKKTVDLVRSRLDVWHMLGYSCAGEVIKVGENIHGFGKGDMVCCCGSGYANHSEYVAVPKNMLAKVPKGVKPEEAAFSGIGAIAMQSIRQLEPTIGETHVVIGLGLIGQLACQILKANGCKVIGIDIDKKKLNKPYIDLGLSSSSAKEVMKFTNNNGADGVIIAAATKANLVNDAFDMCRRKGRVVLLGVCDLNIDRSRMYEKELEFRISTAFGPGYYDPIFEEKNVEYPIGYVRWTMARNMEAFLELIKEKKIEVLSLIEKTYDINDAKEAYRKMFEENLVGALIRYTQKTKPEDEKVKDINDIKPIEGKIKVGIIGAGNFVKGFIIPSLRKIKDFQIYAVATQSGSNSKKLAEELKVKYATTDYRVMLADKSIDLVIIGTRHDTHAEIAAEVMKAGKHVFVEKPAAIYQGELETLKAALKEHRGMFAAGFNRRYAPSVVKIKSLLKKDSPIIVNYVFNNVFLPKDHWVNQEDVGGGRIIGEACHILDLFNYLTGSRPKKIFAEKLTSTTGQVNDDNNMVITVKYHDGSVCNLVYSCIGNNGSDRERCIVMQDGNIIEMGNFATVKHNGRKVHSGSADEGHHDEIIAIRDFLKLNRKDKKEEKNPKAGVEQDKDGKTQATDDKAKALITADEVILATEMAFKAVETVKGQ